MATTITTVSSPGPSIEQSEVTQIGDILVSNGAPNRNALPALRALAAYILNLNLADDPSTASALAATLTGDADAMTALAEALEVIADAFHERSNMTIPFAFQDVDDWVTMAAGDPAGALTTIDAVSTGGFGPEYRLDSITADTSAYQRMAFRPRPGRTYQVTIRGYAETSNSVDLQAIVSQLNGSYVVTTTNKASSQTLNFSAANTLQTLTFTMSVDVAGVDVDLDAVDFVRVGASIGPTAGTSTNCRLTEIRVEDISGQALQTAASIVALITASTTALEALKDAIVQDLDGPDSQAIAADLAGDATALEAIKDAIMGDLDLPDTQAIADAFASQAAALETLKDAIIADLDGTTDPEALASAIAGSVDAMASLRTAIAGASITNAQLENIAQDRLVGRTSTGSGPREELTAAQARTLLNVADGAAANPAAVSQAEAEAGTVTATRLWSPQRVAEAIAALAPTPASTPAAALARAHGVIRRGGGAAYTIAGEYNVTGVSTVDSINCLVTIDTDLSSTDYTVVLTPETGSDMAGMSISNKAVGSFRINGVSATNSVGFVLFEG